MLYGVLDPLRETLQFLLLFSTLIAALFATRLLKEPHQVEVRAHTVRVINEKEVPGITEEVEGILQSYNGTVRRGEGTSTTKIEGSDLVWLDSSPGTPDAEQSLLSELGPTFNAILRPLGGSETWLLQEATGPLARIRQGHPWPEVKGCSQEVAVLNERYGPVACASPPGVLIALEGSPGVPAYAQEIVQGLEMAPEELDALLQAIEESFRLETRVTILNQGAAVAQGIRVVVPPEWTVRAGWVEGRNEGSCPGSGQDDASDFSLGALQSCQISFVTQRGGRSVLPLAPPAVGALPQTPPLLTLVWIVLIVAIGVAVAYLVVNGIVKWREWQERETRKA